MKKLLLLLLAATVFLSCEEKKSDDSLSVSQEQLVFNPSGGSLEFQITSNTSWKIIITGDNPNVNLSTRMGSGDATIKVTLPGTNSMQDVETRLIIRTDDGSSLRNVVLLQHGHLINGIQIGISNWANLLPMDGYALAEDSLTIYSNVPWQLKGPDWIEAYNGTEWVKLSMERAMVSGPATVSAVSGVAGTYDLKIRCASENPNDEDREGTIILESSYDTEKNEDIQVSQLGRYRVDACQVINLCHAIGWTWKCGKDVSFIKYYVGQESYGKTIVSFDQVANWNTSAPGYVCGAQGLKDNTAYFVYTFAFDETGTYTTKTWHAVGTVTEPDVNQPVAPITGVQYDGSQFTYTIVQNDYSYGFFQMVMDSSSPWATADDGQFAWLFNKYLHDVTSNVSTMYTYRQMTFPIQTDNHIHIATWGVAQGTNKMSGLITRFDTYRDWKSSAPSYSEDNTPYCSSMPYNMDEFRKSIILIK